MLPANILIYVLLSLSNLLVPTSSHGDSKQEANNKHIAIFVIGDSVYDPGNNNYLNITIDGKADFPPYGETFFRYPTGRFCDGRDIPDFAATYANLPLWEPYLQPGSHNFTNGASFASAGAGVLVETNPETLDLGKQLSFLKEVANLLKQELGDAEAKKILMDAIYLSSFGGVDYMATLTDNYTGTEQEYVNMVIGNFTDGIKEIYEMGGRKFAFQNVAPLGCQPEMKQQYNLSGGSCVEELEALATLHNAILSDVTSQLQKELPGFQYLIFDYFTALSDMINDPAKYGFKVSYVACCGAGSHRGTACGWLTEEYELCSNPSEYVFFDGGHPTESANTILADFLWNGGSNFTWPINMKQLYELDSTVENLSEDGGLSADE